MASLVDIELWNMYVILKGKAARKTALGPLPIDIGCGEIFYANLKAADTSTIPLGARIIQQIRSERLTQSSSRRDSDYVSALPPSAHFRSTRRQRRGMR